MSSFSNQHSNPSNSNNEDLEMEMILELSRRTFMEEQQLRMNNEQAEEDLIVIEDPNVIQRRETINRIKDLCNNPTNVVYRASQPATSFRQHPPLFRQQPISTSHSFSGPFPNHQQQEQNSQLALSIQALIQQNGSQPHDSIAALPSLYRQPTRNKVVQAGSSSSSMASSVPCTPAAFDFSGPRLIPQTDQNDQKDMKIRSNSFAADSTIDLDDFDPLTKTIGIEESPSTLALNDNLDEIGEGPRELCSMIELPSNHSIESGNNASTYILLDKTLQILPRAGSNYATEAAELAKYTKSIEFDGVTNKKNLLFLATNVDYTTTNADTIKLIVFEDKTWPQDNAEYPRKITFTCNIDRKCEDILVEVLSELLPPDMNEELPLNEYGLRVWGHDLFLDNNSTLGNFQFVGDSLSYGQDVRLEVGKRALITNQVAVPYTRPEYPKSRLLNAQNFEVYLQTMLKLINELAKVQDYTAWGQALELIKLLKSSMNQTLLQEINTAIEAINSATSNKGYEIAVQNFASAIIRQLFAYSRSSFINFSVKTDALQLPYEREELMPIGEAGGNFTFHIESLNNLYKRWTRDYFQFYIHVEIVHGKHSFSSVSTQQKSLQVASNDFLLFEETIEIQQTLISALPRNTSLSFVIMGVSIVDNMSNRRLTLQSDDTRLASGVIPLFDRNGIMLQGPTMLALTELNDQSRILPWGPQKLIDQPANPVLLLSFPEFEHNIVFPSEIQTPEFVHLDYKTLSNEDKSYVEWLILHRYVHLFDLDDDDKKFLWSKRAYLTKLPLALPLVLISSFAWDSVSVGHIYSLLDIWTELQPEDAMELLLPCFADSRIRAKAIEWISNGSSAQILNFIPQLLEAIRYEQYEDSAIAKFLLLQSTKNRLFASELYWQLNQRLVVVDDLRFTLRYSLLQDQLLKLDIDGFQNDISYQHAFLEKLRICYKRMRACHDYNNMNTVLQTALHTMVKNFDISRLRLPLCPSFLCKKLLIDKASHFNSAAKPIALHFNGENEKYSILYKLGDDLRQDSVVMQLVNLINDMWHREGLDMRIITFKCLPTGRNEGLVEMIKDCQTLREIQALSGLKSVLVTKLLNNWIQSNNPSEFLYKQAVENFRKSCAGWSVISYVLGLADRHNDNMMICKTGQLFHIDFGKYFGDVQMAGSINRDRVPFVITKEMATVINQGGLETTIHFQEFVDEMCSAFQCLRKRAAVLVTTMRLMSTSGIPGLDEKAVAFVEDRLMLNKTDDEAGILLTSMIDQVISSWSPRINNALHTIAQGRGNLWKVFFGNNTRDVDHMPFNLEDCSKESDGEILNVYIQGFRKMKDQQDGTKTYLYECKVQRRGMVADPLISRSYEDFTNLHLRLSFKFPNIGIPALGRSRFLVRSNVGSVANDRFIELQHFLQMLFILPPEISHSNLIYNFFHHTLQDSDQNHDGIEHEDPNSSNHAELDLRLIFNPNQSTFRIIVGHARGVQRVASNETYVKFYLKAKDGRAVGGGKKKTDAIKGINPTYNKELSYHLTPTEMTEFFTYILQISVWHKTTSIVRDNSEICNAEVHLNTLQNIQPNLDNVIEKKASYKLS